MCLKESIEFHSVQNIDNFLWKFNPNNPKIINSYKTKILEFNKCYKNDYTLYKPIKLIKEELDN